MFCLRNQFGYVIFLCAHSFDLTCLFSLLAHLPSSPPKSLDAITTSTCESDAQRMRAKMEMIRCLNGTKIMNVQIEWRLNGSMLKLTEDEDSYFVDQLEARHRAAFPFATASLPPSLPRYLSPCWHNHGRPGNTDHVTNTATRRR